jgi:hypothetical protein
MLSVRILSGKGFSKPNHLLDEYVESDGSEKDVAIFGRFRI